MLSTMKRALGIATVLAALAALVGFLIGAYAYAVLMLVVGVIANQLYISRERNLRT